MTESGLTLAVDVLPDDLCLHQLPPDAQTPGGVTDSSFFALVRTPSELSIVCTAQTTVPGATTSTDWRALKVRGPLNLEWTGILARLSTLLAEAAVPIFAVSTFDTDYILVPAGRLDAATDALGAGGVEVNP